jgi:hypothetical protein
MPGRGRGHGLFLSLLSARTKAALTTTCQRFIEYLLSICHARSPKPFQAWNGHVVATRLHLEKRAHSKLEVRRRAGCGEREAGARPLLDNSAIVAGPHRAAEGWHESTVLRPLDNRTCFQS